MEPQRLRQFGTVAAGACAAAGFLTWAVRGRSAAVFGPSVWRGPRDRRALALTFDDGPSEDTPRLLEILAAHHVPATFFQIGANVERLPAVARAVAEAGHTLGNHSYSHPLFSLRSRGFIEGELRRAQEAIEEHTGVRPHWFRAPYGVRWFGVGAAQRRLRLMGVMWTVIGYDWNLEAGAIVKRVAGSAANGAILCLHDGRELRAKPDIGPTVEAVRRLVPMLLDQGYQFETVGRLICPKN
ncbi:MAG: polysaccharide deacetylase family protein [Acidobacteriia bacterium]|nr:polysaccharide deacetylase family protein [Terriglobia bacterium]